MSAAEAPSPVQAAVAGLAIVWRPLRELQPYIHNARRHPDRQIAKLRNSLKRFGWTTALGVAGSELVTGHGRLAAALELAQRDETIPHAPDKWLAPTVDLSHLSEPDRRAYRIADNRIATDAGWDVDLLRIELKALEATGFDLALTGFVQADLGILLGAKQDANRQRLQAGMKYQVIVECDTEQAQADLVERLRAEGITCKPMML